MRVWLYYRLSKDEDPELNSLTNQKNILLDYAIRNDHKVVGESYDDNYSGMNFDRPGIQAIYDELDKKTFDAILVKDLSRLGRHRTETAVFIEMLLKKGVRVISATENLDSSNEDDDLMIGFKGMFNDFYARDISRKVKAGLGQKQKEGLVILPPMGYRKDPVTKDITIAEEPAEIIREIFNLYLQGYGFRAIAKILNEENKPTPRYYQELLHGRSQDFDYPEITTRGLWQSKAVKRILQNEMYCGTLVNHKYSLSKINHTRGFHPEDTWIRHEDYVEPIVSRETWETVQALIELKNPAKVRASTNKPCHRYAGLIECGDCGSVFVSKIRRNADGVNRIEYVCNGYSRYGKEYCPAHRIDERVLDSLISSQLMFMLSDMESKIEVIETEFKAWMKDRGKVERKLEHLENNLYLRKEDQRKILLERLRDEERMDIYNEMLEACEKDIEKIEQDIYDLHNADETIKKRKKGLNSSVDLLRKIVSEKELTNANLRLLVEKIIISENEGKLSIRILLNGNFESDSLLSGQYLLHEAIIGSYCQHRKLTREQFKEA